jgi:predicted transcriptional regulator
MIPDFKYEIRAFILYDFLLKRPVSEAISNNSKLPRQYRVTRHTIKRWYSRFEEGDFSLKESTKSGRPIIIDQSKVKQLAESDPSLSHGDIAKLVGCSRKSISRYLATLTSEKKVSQMNIQLNLKDKEANFNQFN